MLYRLIVTMGLETLILPLITGGSWCRGNRRGRRGPALESSACSRTEAWESTRLKTVNVRDRVDGPHVDRPNRRFKSCPRHHTRLPGFKRRVNELPTIYIDGQSIGNEQRVQPRAAKIAFVYQTSDSGPPTRDSKVYFKDIGNKTNNEAEYHALLAALSFISRNLAGKGPDVRNVRTCSDSKLLVNQVNGDWKIETERLKQLREKAAIVVAQLGLRRLVWVPRDQNYAGLWLEGKWEARGEPITWSYY